jgi:hypothetical protein
MPYYNRHIKSERRMNMPDEVTMVKVFAKMMVEDQDLFARFLKKYISECDKYNLPYTLETESDEDDTTNVL